MDVRRCRWELLVQCFPTNTISWTSKTLIVCICTLLALVALQFIVFPVESDPDYNTNNNVDGQGIPPGPRKLCKCKHLTYSVGKDRLFNENLKDPLRAGQYAYSESTCSNEATLLGRNQSVIAFSLFSTSEKGWNYTKGRYFDGIIENLRLMKEIYPGWVMRVYTNLSYSPEVCKVVCSDESIYFCDTHRLPQIGDVSNIHPMAWRFLAMGDPTVKEFAVRDLDSRLSQREKDCVDQWEKSEYPLHGMRDHPRHGTEIMGGMWGADNQKLGLTLAKSIQQDILKKQKGNVNDQALLTRVIWSTYRMKILTHDSYLCERYKDGVPFPTKRQNESDYVGRCVFEEICGISVELPKCPIACRPVYGKSWKYC